METGLDQLASISSTLGGARLGLLAHPASVDRELVHVRDLMERQGIRPLLIFGPEHGYGGEAQDMIGVDDAQDIYGTPIRSLYGERFDDLIPREDDLTELDVLVVDLQDVGSRYYTFVWTAVLALRACVSAGIRMVVLDRPNPIGADVACVQGRAQKPPYRSFVGLEPIPVRHALTLGEIVAWRAELGKVPPSQLAIVPVRGLPRDAHATAWDRPFVMPSPNMPSYDTALVYPGGCLVEGTNLSEGRGTTRPFEIVGAPWLDGPKLARDLQATGLPGFIARPLTFRPTFQKHAGKVCGGLQIHVTDARAFRPVATYIALVALAHHQSPSDFRFRTEKYEFIDDIPAFDLLTGDAEARERISRRDDPLAVANAIAEASEEDRSIVETAIAARARYEHPA